MNKSKTVVLGFPDYRPQAMAFATAAGLDYEDIYIHVFPDGESKLVIPVELPRKVILFRSLDHPNEKLVELILAASAVRQQGCSDLMLIVPYLCYMRQDIAFHPGEVVSQKIIGALLANYFDAVITVDSHLHRISKLSEAIPVAEEKAINLTATEPMAKFLQQSTENAFLLGPDAESEQWVKAIASHEKLDYGVANKQRYGDRNVSVVLPEAEFNGRNIVLVDDVASTGKTLLAAIDGLKKHQPASVNILVTHALFSGRAAEDLLAAGANAIWSCDSINHPTNRISLAPLLAENLPAQDV